MALTPNKTIPKPAKTKLNSFHIRKAIKIKNIPKEAK